MKRVMYEPETDCGGKRPSVSGRGLRDHRMEQQGLYRYRQLKCFINFTVEDWPIVTDRSALEAHIQKELFMHVDFQILREKRIFQKIRRPALNSQYFRRNLDRKLYYITLNNI